ncbi:undecaprenyl-phosphate glucose phosphotransferase [Litoribacter alkaliphilus]|uniref:Undecaprenyl-phosphate glucose phosphotransferase n=1 Tax=Litoribacter ruber TaxID=702568 RepID=A0AAP2CGN8_9BACT|nr:undecaprenyl-phosphate glucose phosphotransferase [Litoribacter alkaliphilus]MBS9523465.1 undecaprenyl-phosphate glucose phosphotransferase [Litoribacter alkaliphilus]
MAKRFYKNFPWLFSLGDAFIIVLSLLLSKVILGSIFNTELSSDVFYLGFLMVWLGVTLFRKDYKLGRTTDYSQTLKQLFGSVLWFVAIISVLWVLFQTYHLSRLYLLINVHMMLILLSVYRVAVHIALKQYRIKGGNYRNAVIIGKGGASNRLAQMLSYRRDFGINFLGYFDDAFTCMETKGKVSDFFDQAEQMELDLIYINENLEADKIKQIINYADDKCIKVKIIPDKSLQLEKNLSFSKYGDFLVINVNDIPLDNVVNRFAKRAFDIIFSSLVIVFILSWLIPLVGLLIKLESKGPIFFIQERNGENNRVFRCLKFRSMTPNDYADTQQAIKDDPRVTTIGAFLRSTSLDEMPQFINVLFGEMSIVGPRPHTVPMNQTFKQSIEKYNTRHKIKPGITGLAQVKGYRGEIEMPYQIRSRVRLDYFYIQNWSIWLDLSIVVKTVHELMFNRENAY